MYNDLQCTCPFVHVHVQIWPEDVSHPLVAFTILHIVLCTRKIFLVYIYCMACFDNSKSFLQKTVYRSIPNKKPTSSFFFFQFAFNHRCQWWMCDVLDQTELIATIMNANYGTMAIFWSIEFASLHIPIYIHYYHIFTFPIQFALHNGRVFDKSTYCIDFKKWVEL